MHKLIKSREGNKLDLINLANLVYQRSTQSNLTTYMLISYHWERIWMPEFAAGAC